MKKGLYIKSLKTNGWWHVRNFSFKRFCSYPSQTIFCKCYIYTICQASRTDQKNIQLTGFFCHHPMESIFSFFHFFNRFFTNWQITLEWNTFYVQIRGGWCWQKNNMSIFGDFDDGNNLMISFKIFILIEL